MGTLIEVRGPIVPDTATSISAVLTYEVDFLENTVTSAEARQAAGLPAIGDLHPYVGSILRVDDKKAVKRGSTGTFDVSVTYVVNDPSIGGDQATNPLARPTRWSSSPDAGSAEVDTKKNGTDPIENSSKQPLKLTIPYSDKTLTATAISATEVDYDSFFNKVNSGVYRGYAAKRLLLTGVSQSFTQESYNGAIVEYYQQTFTFRLLIPRTAADPVTWDQRYLDEGTVELVSGNQEPILDERSHTYITSPVKLDGAGLRLDPPTLTAQFLTAEVYDTADFSLLGI